MLNGTSNCAKVIQRPGRPSLGLLAGMLFGLIALLIPTARAQVTSGTIFGAVQDATGALVPNAAIAATDLTIGVTRSTTTSSAGTFSLPNLPPGWTYFPTTTREIRACLAKPPKGAVPAVKPGKKCSAEERILGLCN